MNPREETTARKRSNERGRHNRKKARKRGGGNTGGQSKSSYRDYRRGGGQDAVQSPTGGAAKQRRRRKTKQKRAAAKKINGATPLLPISCPSSNSIMRSWKQALGPLIRYYVGFKCKQGVPQMEVEAEIESIYFSVGCGKEETKLEILRRLGMTDTNKDLVDVTMIIEKDEQMRDVPTVKDNSAEDVMTDNNTVYTETRDGKGLKLHKTIQRGEGPAHAHEHWTSVIIPDWAVGKSFFFECKNNAPLPLSCALFLDGQQVAFNAPLPSNSDRSIKPDNQRYSHRHQWLLSPVKRVKFRPNNENSARANTDDVRQPVRATPRYNYVRPDYEGQRVSEELFPDASSFGWTFTGSQQASRVEFFEKRLNIGLVKLDFYYTTGTIKTTLHHPSTGKNQLFRGGLTPEQYVGVLNNPRAHTNQGYRRRVDRPENQGDGFGVDENYLSDDEFDQIPRQDENAVEDIAMEEYGDNAAVDTTYFARNDGYNFNRQGHKNRRDEMSKLQNSEQYAEWRKANLRDYSVITAKFYVSVPKRQYGGQVSLRQPRRKKERKLLPIPTQSSVVDVKAAEKATIGTKYQATGPPQRIVRSFVRMERINGLTDEKDWKGEPVFEKKLYYRAEHILKGLQLDNDDDDSMSDDDEPSHDVYTLAKYKELMMEKIQQHRPEMDKIFSHDDAEMKIRCCITKIYQAESIQDVDDQVSRFLNEFFPGLMTK